MNKIIEMFNLQREEGNLGDYILLANLVKGNNYHEATIAKLFNKLVSKDDYEMRDKPLLMKHLIKLSTL